MIRDFSNGVSFFVYFIHNYIQCFGGNDKKPLFYKKSLTDKRFKYKIKYIIKLFNKVIIKVQNIWRANNETKNNGSSG